MLPARISRTVLKAKRQPRPGDSEPHLRWLRKLPCVLCLRPADDPHHLMRVRDGAPKGVGRRNEDRHAIPVCRPCHRLIHKEGAKDDEAFLASRKVDARALAAALWRNSGDDEAGYRLVYRAPGVRA